MAPKKAASLLGLEELTNNKNGLGKALVAEAIGVFFINYFGCLSCLNAGSQSLNFTVTGIGGQLNNATFTSNSVQFSSQTVATALSFGLIVFAMVQTLGHVSGAHLNPAITVGLLAAGKVTVIRGLLYVIAQCIGAIAGSGVLKILVPENFGATSPSSTVNSSQALGLELFLGFILVFVVCGVCDPNKPYIKLNAALAIGFTVTLGHLTTIGLTGSSMNPARSLGSAVVTGVWASHWVYWVGPCVGGAIASLFYNFILAAPQAGEYAPVNVEEKELKRLDSKNDEVAA
ncbi:hypothetical protein V9T40_000381 [Parthenolecanium corni]|uniref:Aquaporin n=1 Tax=Parthenolecanium corni TaxID=536013 RepID=A0AAN9T9F5_9HEMI